MASPHPRAEPFRAALDIEASGDLALRLGTARLPAGGGADRASTAAAKSGTAWVRGVPGDWLARLIEDWRAFDPLTLQARLDRLTHLRAEVDGVSVHLVHAPGTGPDMPFPATLLHAVEAFEDDKVVRGALDVVGAGVSDYFAKLKRDEFFEWHATVGDWEHDHYLTAF